MKALLLSHVGQLDYVEVPSPDLGPSDVLVRVKACGICGSDVHGMDGSTGRRIPPLVMGHEAAGVVAAVGALVSGWKTGDRVTFDSTISCGECSYCGGGLVNLCDDRRVLGVASSEYRQDGAFAEYVAVPQHTLYRLPEAVSFVEAAMVEPLAVVAHAVSRAQPGPEDTVLIMGCGVIGLLILQMIRARGCHRIIVVDVDHYRIERALGMGAVAAFRSDLGGVDEAIRDRTSGRGVDIAYEAVGRRSSVDMALAGLRKGGVAVLIGNLERIVDLPLQAVVTRQLSLLGCAASAGEYPSCIDLIASRAVNVNEIVSAVAPLSEGASWFERLRRGGEPLLKVVLEP